MRCGDRRGFAPHQGSCSPRTACTSRCCRCPRSTSAGACPQLIERLERGETLALCTDAGTPVLSDPGAILVRAALDGGHRVTPIPGASALTAALASSGFPASAFCFLGFLPRTAGKLVRVLEEAMREDRTIAFFESPMRITKTLPARDTGPRRAADRRRPRADQGARDPAPGDRGDPRRGIHRTSAARRVHGGGRGTDRERRSARAGRHPLPPGPARGARPARPGARRRRAPPASTRSSPSGSTSRTRSGTVRSPSSTPACTSRADGIRTRRPPPTPRQLDALGELLRHPKAVAVGEVGLDLFFRPGYHEVPLDIQERSFRTMLELAQRRGQAGAHPRPRRARRGARPRCARCPGAEGSCTASAATRRSPGGAPSSGFIASFSGIVTFPRSEGIQDAARTRRG